MCGIVGYVGRSAATPVLLSGLRRLEYRGYDSAGLTVQDGKTLLTLRAVGKVARLADKVRADWPETTQARCVAGIAHTRWATHGAPTEANAHPHADAAGRIRLVHNGIIENYRTLRTKLEAKGHVFSSETDTEAVARLIGEYYKGDLRKAVISALRQVEGAYGIAVISADEPGRIVVARKGSPLVIGVGEGECLIASDPSAIISHTRRVIYLDDGDVALVTADSVDITDLNHAPMDRDVAELEFEAGAVEKGGFEHFMLKEIHEQPESVRNALRGRLDLLNGTAVLSGMGATARELLELHRIVMVGCGTSLHAGMVGDFAFEDLAAKVSAVSPDCEMATTRSRPSTSGFR